MQKHKTIILTITLGMLLIPHTCITSETNPVDPKIKPELAVLGNDTMSFIRAGKWKQTEALLKQIYKVSGESLEYFYLKGAYLYSRGNFQEAKKNIDKALEKNHMHDPSNYVSGMIHTRFRNYDVASEFFERAAQSGTYNPFYRMNFAVSLFLKGDYAKAKVEFEKTIELKSNFSDAKICLLRTLVRSDKKKEALQFSSKLIEEKIISEETREIYSRMIFELNNDYFGAIKTLSGLKNISLSGRRVLAISYFRTGDLIRSAELYKKIIDSGKDNEADDSDYLQVLLLSEKYDDADALLVSISEKSFSGKEGFLLTYLNTIEERKMLESMHSAIPWR